MGKPTIYQTFRQVVGRAFRETGQALDRAGIKGHQLAVTKRVIGDDPVVYQDHLSRHRQRMPLLRRGKPVVSEDVAFLAPCATLIGSVHIGAGSSVFYKSILRADNCDNAEAFSSRSESASALAVGGGGGGESSSSSNAIINNHNNNNNNGDNDNNNNDTDGSSKDTEQTPAALETTAHHREREDRHRHPSEWDLDPNRALRSNSTATGGGIFVGECTNIQDGCIIDARTDHTRIGNGVTVGHLASIHSATVRDHCLIGMGSLLQEGVVVMEESVVAAGANLSRGTVVGPGELWVGSPARKVRDLTAEERERLHYQADAYVEVASALKDNMLLGGNLPDSLSQYMDYGHDGEYEYDQDEDEDVDYDSGYEEDCESSGESDRVESSSSPARDGDEEEERDKDNDNDKKEGNGTKQRRQ